MRREVQSDENQGFIRSNRHYRYRINDDCTCSDPFAGFLLIINISIALMIILVAMNTQEALAIFNFSFLTIDYDIVSIGIKRLNNSEYFSACRSRRRGQNFWFFRCARQYCRGIRRVSHSCLGSIHRNYQRF